MRNTVIGINIFAVIISLYTAIIGLKLIADNRLALGSIEIACCYLIIAVVSGFNLFMAKENAI